MNNISIVSTSGKFLAARCRARGVSLALLAGFIGISLPVAASRAQPAPLAPAREIATNAPQTTNGVKQPVNAPVTPVTAKSGEKIQTTGQPAQPTARREAEENAEAIAAKTNAAIAEEVARRRAYQAQIQARQAAANQTSETMASSSAKREPAGKESLGQP